MRSATQPVWGVDGAAVMSARTVSEFWRHQTVFTRQNDAFVCTELGHVWDQMPGCPTLSRTPFLMLKSLLINSVALEPSLWQNACCVHFIFIQEIRRDKIKLYSFQLNLLGQKPEVRLVTTLRWGRWSPAERLHVHARATEHDLLNINRSK